MSIRTLFDAPEKGAARDPLLDLKKKVYAQYDDPFVNVRVQYTHFYSEHDSEGLAIRACSEKLS